MKREEIKAIFPDATDEQLKSVMDLNGNDVEKAKGNAAARLAEAKKAYDDLSAEFEKFKSDHTTAEDFKAKFETLQKEVAEKEAAARAETEKAEKAERINARFAAVLGDKKFSHEAIKADYLHKFAEAIENQNNAGKSDADILHELTKDDAAAFVGVQTVKLAGSKQGSDKSPLTKEQIMAIKNNGERRQAMADALAANPNFFE